MVEQLFGVGVIGRQGQCALGFSASQVELLLVEVDSGQHGANDRGITHGERGLEFEDGVIELAAAAIDFGQATMRGVTGGIGRERGSEFGLGGIEASLGKFLTTATDVGGRRCRGSRSRAGCGSRRGWR